MESKVNYTLVGMFVVVLSLAIIYVIIWLSAGISHKHYTTYLAFFTESVSGLSEQAPVKYNGVQVGFVDKIDLSAKDPGRVKLVLKVENSVPILQNTTATLETQGITGIVYIGLRSGDSGAPPLTTLPGKEYPVIATKPSLFSRLDVAISRLTENMDHVTIGLHQLLNDKNQAAIQISLQNIQSFTTHLANDGAHLDDILKNFDTTLQNTAIASKHFPELITQLTESGKNFSSTLQSGRMVLNNISSQLAPTLYGTLENINTLSSHLNALTQQLEQQPAVLLRGRSIAPPGPGEK